ncbi:MAG TPA: DUF6088 family protein [Thermoanaerobaculia bacterium]|nr:DUF6088 family protein [Thermoanaerobaculia bacterium]
MSGAKESPQSTETRILKRIRRRGSGSVFTASDFLDLAGRSTVDWVLARLVRRGGLRRLARGLYDYPARHPVLGELSPPVEAIAKALAGRDRLKLLPGPAYAANLLHLSEQVPARVVFLTDGLSRKVKVGNQEIHLQHTTPRNLAGAGRASGLVIQALRHLGKKAVSFDRVAPLHALLEEKDRRQLLEDLPLAPAWMHPFLRAIAEGGPTP